MRQVNCCIVGCTQVPVYKKYGCRITRNVDGGIGGNILFIPGDRLYPCCFTVTAEQVECFPHSRVPIPGGEKSDLVICECSQHGGITYGGNSCIVVLGSIL